MRTKTARITILLLLIALAFPYACKDKTGKKTGIRNFDSRELPAYIESELKFLSRDTSFRNYFDTLRDYYALNKYKPLWLDEMQDSMFLVELKKLSDSCVYEGLKPEHYHLSGILSFLAKSKTGKLKDSYRHFALADVYISNFMVSLWHDKVLGRTDPRIVLGMKYTLPYPNHPEFQLMDVLVKKTGLARLKSYYPGHPDFWPLKQLLLDAYALTAGSETMIDTVGIRKLVPGDTTTIVPMLATRLVELGLAPDSILPLYANEIVYKKKLAAYVMAFQKNSNLTDDGIIGKSTLRILNASHNDRIDEIRANIERIKWFGIEPPKPFIRVNIPEFILYMHYPDSVKTLLVCVGKGKERYFDQKSKRYVLSKSYMDKPLNHETPQIYSNIDFVILNPTWTVPSSIVGREMYNLIVRNPGYLIKNNYEVFKDGVKVDPYSINWRRMSPGNIPYTIRQNAGDDNSLGKIKFTFKNPFDVYLHDTPLKNKFKQSNRAVSHGCVRVQSPVDLTGFVLQQNVKNTYDDVLIMMGLPPTDTARARKWLEDTTSYKKIKTKTYPVRVENKLTVFFDYRTIVFDAINKPRFVFDVYDKNRSIVDAMNTR